MFSTLQFWLFSQTNSPLRNKNSPYQKRKNDSKKDNLKPFKYLTLKKKEKLQTEISKKQKMY